MTKYEIKKAQISDSYKIYCLIKKLKPQRIFDELTKERLEDEVFKNKNNLCLVAKKTIKSLVLSP